MQNKNQTKQTNQTNQTNQTKQTLTRLKYTEIKSFRAQLLQQQNNRCALCNEIVDPTEAVLDHSHSSGQIRSVLHRGCNCLLGKIENNLTRNRITSTRLHNILKNYESYVTNPTDVLHPTYKNK